MIGAISKSTRKFVWTWRTERTGAVPALVRESSSDDQGPMTLKIGKAKVLVEQWEISRYFIALS